MIKTKVAATRRRDHQSANSPKMRLFSGYVDHELHSKGAAIGAMARKGNAIAEMVGK